jgi:hypothetical protein
MAAVVACGMSGMTFADTGFYGASVTLSSGNTVTNGPNDILFLIDGSTVPGEAIRFLQEPMTLASNRVIESTPAIQPIELRDTGQLFLALPNRGGVLPSGSLVLTPGGILSITSPNFDMPANVYAGAMLSVTGAGNTMTVRPASHVTLASAQVQLTSEGDAITLAELSRHSGPFASFAARQHGSVPRNEEHHENDGHHGHGEHHGGPRHNGGDGQHWNFHGNHDNCDISPAIPEPTSYAFMLTGLLVLWGAKRRWRKNGNDTISS